MAGPLDPFDPTRPQLPDNSGELPATLRAIKEVLVDYRNRIEELESLVAANLGATTGQIVPWGSNSGTPPQGFLFCNGGTASREDFSDLFAVVGTIWGNGDGVSTFGLPDLRGRTVRGLDGGVGRDHEQNRIVGSYQEDKLQNLVGSLEGIRIPNGADLEGGGVFEITKFGVQVGRYSGSSSTGIYNANFAFANDDNARTANETTVKNACVQFIIKT